MDWIGIRERLLEAFKKYRYILLVMLVGLFLMLLPEGKSRETVPELPAQTTIQSSEKDLQESLADILSMIEGAGKVQVLLTEGSGERIRYQTDENITSGENSNDIRRDTVIVTGASRVESGLIQQIDPPVYQGAVILCQGADRASVRLAIVEAVSNATGLGSDKISVLKMKG